jgi:hypothetical protein
VLFFPEEIEEGGADLGGGHGGESGRGEFDGITEFTKLTELEQSRQEEN